MSRDSSMTELNGFLAKHEPVAKPRLYDIGSVLGEWRVTAFLGSGGNAEVYRVVRVDGTRRTSGTSRTAGTDGRGRSPVSAEAKPSSRSESLEQCAPQPKQNETPVEESVGALKILLREDDASKTRFRQEAALLSAQMGASFAKFYATGEIDGRPYLVTELLEPVDLPSTEKEIVDYILAVCRAVGVLHRAGLIHRDIKPSNIMRRANGELVLIDLGLVKDAVKTSEPERDVSIVSQKVIAVGTPRFAAPEQMTGGRVTAATDVHAIGRLADVAFRSNPPRSWLPIIRRATSSIPDQRYQTVEDLVQAIKHRNRPRAFVIAAGACILLSLVGMTVGRARTSAALHVDATSSSRQIEKRESVAWESLCKNATTNLIVKELAYERLVTNKVGNSTMVVPAERAYRQVQKQTDVTLVRLNGQTNEFSRAIVLDASREYFIEGPGILSANFKAKGGMVRVHLKNCFLFNNSTEPIGKANVRYVFEGGAYLNFTNQDEPPRSVVNAHVEEFDGAYDQIRFRGPVRKQDLDRIRDDENRAVIDRAVKTFFKILHLPRHFFAPRGKYVVEDMEDSIYKKYGIDPNRVPTDAEVELVAFCFDVSKSEAVEIIKARHSNEGHPRGEYKAKQDGVC